MSALRKLQPSRRALLAAPLVALPFPALARQAAAPIAVPVVFANARILTNVTIAGSGPYHFVIDTGAVIGGIREDLAAELHLKALRNVRLGGGGGPDNYIAYEATDVVVGDAYRQPSMVLFGLKARSTALGGDGLLAGVMTKVDATLDPANAMLTLYPQGGADRGGFQRVPSDIRADPGADGAAMIYVDVELDGVTRRMLVDTGQPGNLALSPQVVRDSGLWDDARPYAPAVMKGIGGLKRLHGRTVRAKSLKLGPLTLERPLVTLNDPGMGRGPSGFDGIVGLALIRQLVLSTDIAARTLWVRLGGLDASPERYNRSGLWFDEQGGRVTVTDVGPGSPAALAGIKVGDRLKPGIGMGAATNGFGEQAGTVITLPFERGDVTFTLKDYL